MSRSIARVDAFAAWLTLVCVPALAGDVHVVGVTPGISAEVAIGGGTPITLDLGGPAVEGVRLVRADRTGAVVVIDGITHTLPLVPAGASDSVAAPRDTVTLSADAGGQFTTSGAVNGRGVRFVVDTGATVVALSRHEAERVGVDYRRGTPQQTMTANGTANGWRVSLDAVSVGDATMRNVDAMVIDNDALPVVLLGMSFLRHFDMQHQGRTLVLRRR